ncbi:hypothetical protein PVAND_012497 [Polypedilum vanderplanki]|uniref:Peptidase S1 domain-containing protein n=1 Tax=Polypedilum vanderplanki TaxID=319348 RepID=A0A9J6CLT6_POLVA|nr:hypothetical protein PVAND_012497 [Polypedilum vanderplanki]
MMKIILVFMLCVKIFHCSVINLHCITKTGHEGTCKSITDCEAFNQNLNEDDINDMSPCDFDGSIGIYCCPNFVHPLLPQLTKSCNKTLRIKDQMKPHFADFNENSKISSINELPFMVQVMLLEKGFVGSGVLINEKFVLTSAHAVYFRKSMPICRFGKTTRDDLDRLIGIDINVMQVIPHELYIPRELYFDIALLLLERNIKFSDNVFPICLYNSEIKLNNNQKFMLSGWKSNGRKVNELMKGKVEEITKSKCQHSYENESYIKMLPDGITDNLFCGKFGSCMNTPDSDGSLFININDTFFVYGFASTINTNCNSQSPGIYSRISDMINWIENIVTETP